MLLFVQSLVNGLLLGGIYASCSAGFSLAFGVMGVVNLSHGDFVMLGAFLTYWLLAMAGIDPFLTLPVTLVALFLLGLGWNFTYVAGSTLLADQLSPTERAKTQGFNDLLLGLAAAAGSFGSGMMFAVSGYGLLGLVAASAALMPLGLAVWWQVRCRRARSALV